MTRHALPDVCPDCGGTLEAILLFGRGPQSPVGAAIDTAVAYYARADADRGFWMRMFEAAGEVHAGMCISCRRILLYGVPNPG
jgi:hypothetical protein